MVLLEDISRIISRCRGILSRLGKGARHRVSKLVHLWEFVVRAYRFLRLVARIILIQILIQVLILLVALESWRLRFLGIHASVVPVLLTACSAIRVLV